MACEITLAALAAAFLALIVWLAVPVCPTEDSNNCLWNARTQGNGQGSSFIDVGGYLIRL